MELVICGEMVLSLSEAQLYEMLHNDYHHFCRYTSVIRRIWLDDVRCNLSSVFLANCTHNGFGTENCDNSKDVAVSCSLRKWLSWSITDQDDDCNSHTSCCQDICLMIAAQLHALVTITLTMPPLTNHSNLSLHKCLHTKWYYYIISHLVAAICHP